MIAEITGCDTVRSVPLATQATCSGVTAPARMVSSELSWRAMD